MIVITHDSHRIVSLSDRLQCEKCGFDSTTKIGRTRLKEKCKGKKK